MSRYVYEGRFENPANDFYVKEVGDHFEIWVREDRAADGSAPPDHKHTMRGNHFDEAEEAHEAIEQIGEFFEEDYEDYLETHHDEIVQQERYEAFRNEY